jgi:site-specific DNA-cytosine methylase
VDVVASHVIHLDGNRRDSMPRDPAGHQDDVYEVRPSGLYVPRRPCRPLRAADLFCGCGVFMQQAGIDVVAAVERDPWAIVTYLMNLGSRAGCAVRYISDADRVRLFKVLNGKRSKSNTSGWIAPADPKTTGWIGAHNPDRTGRGCRAMITGDATQVTGDTIRETLAAVGESPDIDVVFGGPPCQGMSKAGKQRPDDERNNLTLEFWRIAIELGARAVVMENVPPLLTERKFRPLFDAIVERAVAAGYTIVANVLDAVNYGVPQRRRRAFVVGTRDGVAFQFPMPVTWAFGAGPGVQRWSFLDRDDRDADELRRTKSGQCVLFGDEVRR